MPRRARPPVSAFDIREFLKANARVGRVVTYRRGGRAFTQGELSTSVLYLQGGGIKLSVLSSTGKEAVVAMLAAGDFFGEGALAGQPRRMATATATTTSTVLVIERGDMATLLHAHQDFSDYFIQYMLARNIRIEADLVDHLFNSSEKRLARALLLLSQYGHLDKSERVLPRISQETLAEMIGTTRSRVNFFMNKFKKLGFVDYDARGMTVHGALLAVVLHD